MKTFTVRSDSSSANETVSAATEKEAGVDFLRRHTEIETGKVFVKESGGSVFSSEVDFVAENLRALIPTTPTPLTPGDWFDAKRRAVPILMAAKTVAEARAALLEVARIFEQVPNNYSADGIARTAREMARDHDDKNVLSYCPSIVQSLTRQR